jgi:putative transposase
VSRPLRIEFPGAWYHVLNRGTNRQAIFHDPGDYQAFLNLAGETARMWNLEIHAFALMTNHFHLLMHTPNGNLSRAMQHLGSVYAQRYNHRHHRDGPVFRGRFKAILIEADVYLLQLVRYIHLNPVKAALVDDPAHYPWSSHQLYLTRTAPVDWLVTHAVLSRFGRTWQAAVQRYREFVSQGVPQSLEQVYDQEVLPVILGAEDFRAWVKRLLRTQHKEDYEVPQSKDPRFHPGVEEAFAVCQRAYRVPRSDFTGIRRAHWNEPRDVLIYLCRRECGLPLKEIASTLGIAAYTTVSMACARVEAKSAQSPAFRTKLHKLVEHIRQPPIVD